MPGTRPGPQAAAGRTFFTLVELLIVVAILAILASMLVPALKNARTQAVLTSCLGNQKQMYAALSTYTEDNHGVFPPGGFYSGDQLTAPLHLTGNAGGWGEGRPGAAGWPGTGTIYQFMGRVIYQNYLAREVMLDPGAVCGPEDDVPVNWYPAVVGWDKFAYVAPSATKPVNETVATSGASSPGVVGWYAQYFHDYRDTPGWNMPRIMGRTPAGGKTDPNGKATTAVIMCYQEGARRSDGTVAHNGAHERRWLNCLYEDGRARSLSGFAVRKAQLDGLGAWIPTTTAHHGVQNYWKWAMTEDAR